MTYWIVFLTLLLAFAFRKQIYKYEFAETDGLLYLVIEWIKLLVAIIAYISTMIAMALVYTMMVLYAILTVEWIVNLLI